MVAALGAPAGIYNIAEPEPVRRGRRRHNPEPAVVEEEEEESSSSDESGTSFGEEGSDDGHGGGLAKGGDERPENLVERAEDGVLEEGCG